MRYISRPSVRMCRALATLARKRQTIQRSNLQDRLRYSRHESKLHSQVTRSNVKVTGVVGRAAYRPLDKTTNLAITNR